MKMKKILLVMLLMSMCFGSPAFAELYGYLDETYLNTNPSGTATIVTPDPDGQGWIDGSVYAGVVNLRLDNFRTEPTLSEKGIGIPDAWKPYLQGDVQAFCIDLDDTVYRNTVFSPKVVDLWEAPDDTASTLPDSGGMGADKAADLTRLLNNYWVDDLDSDEAESLQIAVWEIVHEDSGNPWNVDYGTQDAGLFSVRYSQSEVDRAQDWLDAIASDGSLGIDGQNYYLGLSLPSQLQQKPIQDFVVRVPLPTAVWLGLMGFGVAASRLRKKRA